MTSTLNRKIVWASLDPLKKQIHFYPKVIGARIEKKYGDYKSTRNEEHNSCILGSDFYNATIHFNVTEDFYQTTPPMDLGRMGFKKAGNRSVIRLDVTENKSYEINAIYVNRELRITKNLSRVNKRFEGEVPEENIIDTDLLSYIPTQLNAWLPTDIVDKDPQTNVIVWEWCLGIPEKQGYIMKLGEKWWRPYLFEQNQNIENAFQAHQNNIIINIPSLNVSKDIRFNRSAAFATQVDCLTKKIRYVRRHTMTIEQLQKKLDSITYAPLSLAELISQVDTDEVPHEFICCISQAIMTDPVKTVDGMVYDKLSIEQWFIINNTSPLTGLPLLDLTLTPYTELKENIETFIKLKIEQKEKMTNSHRVVNVS